jgi:hypothetical protein
MLAGAVDINATIGEKQLSHFLVQFFVEIYQPEFLIHKCCS